MPTKLDAVKQSKNWNTFFAETVDEALKQIFKDEGAVVIYDFLEKHASIQLEDAADKPDIFSTSLERLMVSAAHVIEQTILNKLYSKMGLVFEEKNDYKFSDYIKELREE